MGAERMRVGAMAVWMALALASVDGCRRRPPAPVPAAGLHAAVDADHVPVGRALTYTLTLTRPAGPAPTLTDPFAGVTGLVVEDMLQDPVVREGAMVVERRHYRLRAEAEGSHLVPAPEAHGAAADDRLVGESVEVTVGPPAPPGDQRDIYDLDPLLPVLPRRPLAWWPWAAAAAVAAAAALLVARTRRRARRPQVVPPPPPPERVARAALAALAMPADGDAVAAEAFCTQLSQLLRAYVEGQFHLNATDLTTEEILARAATALALAPAPLAVLREVLRETDGVKFARLLPPAAAFAAWAKQAEAFVAATVPRPPREGAE